LLDPKDPGTRAELRAWLALQRALHLVPQDAIRLLEHSPDPGAALRLARPSRVGSRSELDRDVARLAALGVRVLPWTSNLYPPSLGVLPDAAPVLLVRGEPAVLLGRAVAVVGARAATVYGLEAAREIGATLARHGVVVVSGLARGIDAAAHRGALAAGGLSVAWMASGPETVYPAEHALLADEIAASGAVVTEMPLGTPPRPQYFPLRNRLISGVSELVVVVEARLRSGSLSTARRALDQGRDVMAVPGPIDAPTSAGPNALLRDGARPVCAAADVLDALGLGMGLGEGGRGEGGLDEKGSDVAPRAPHQADGQVREVLRCLARGAQTRDQLARRVGLDPGALAVALLDLELSGRVATDRDGRLRIVRRA
jgi:DNA processing protein